MLTDEEIQATDAWWRAANYLSAGQIYPGLRRSCVMGLDVRL
jgi:phosphoketolase